MHQSEVHRHLNKGRFREIPKKKATKKGRFPGNGEKKQRGRARGADLSADSSKLGAAENRGNPGRAVRQPTFAAASGVADQQAARGAECPVRQLERG
jgi:hypothetical protein